METRAEPPKMRELDRSEIEDILARNNVGRIGYVRDKKIDIQPVHYVFSDGWIYGRTSYGAKYEALGDTAYQWWPVVFEVDEVESLFRWRSILVSGGFYVIPEEGEGTDDDVRARALELLRTLIPGTMTADDPVPFRNDLFRIALQEATGRESTPG